MNFRYVSLGLVWALASHAFGNPKADLVTYEEKIVPLLNTYCMDCHDDDATKGNFSLEAIDPNVMRGDNLEQWRLIEEQIHFGDMPPKKKEVTFSRRTGQKVELQRALTDMIASKEAQGQFHSKWWMIKTLLF